MNPAEVFHGPFSGPDLGMDRSPAGHVCVAPEEFSDYGQRMTTSMVSDVRRFNRVVTRRIGVLNDRYLASDRSLGQSRILFEIGAHGVDVRDLRARLDLDSGYVSRMLRALENSGLVTVRSHSVDARRRTAELTPAGREELARLDARSDDSAAAILRPLNPSQRDQLIQAMAVVERLMTASLVEVQECDPTASSARFCLETYYRELAERFDGGYDPDLSPVADAEMSSPSGVLLVASLHGQPVGCGALIFERSAAHIKRMWVSPAHRGLGIGRRILDELEGKARPQGASTVRLETRNELHEAIGMYEAAGYRSVDPFNDDPYAHRWYEKTLDT